MTTTRPRLSALAPLRHRNYRLLFAHPRAPNAAGVADRPYASARSPSRYGHPGVNDS
ncbi:hypothetical protein [Micromonospora sp. CA-111912]|uniref:hypothetical protein n=1 Tax=Micromonospora sp. CA-111912 TaxID=3239955 RepID=UPI003D8F02FA